MFNPPLLHNYPLRRARVVIGLISGTSADGIDAAAVRFPPATGSAPLEVLKFLSIPYPADVREQVMLAAKDELSMRKTAILGTRLGHLFAEAALAVIPEAGCDLVASHGQTVAHLPEDATTLQIGDASIIACRTGVVTISDFRTADMACGGQGAPLVPLFDAHVLAHPQDLRIAVNLGGIANITVIPSDGAEALTAWDTGPANCVSDALCRLGGLGDFDHEGNHAAQGKVQEELLQELLAHPYFAKPAPKSTGLEEFGESYARGLIDRAPLPDLLRTVLALTAQTLVNEIRAVARAAYQSAPELVFAGGGTGNATLMGEIKQRLQDMQGLDAIVRSFSEFGIPEGGREAVAFAFLGDLTARGLPGTAPGATGAKRAAILGKVSFPSNGSR